MKNYFILLKAIDFLNSRKKIYKNLIVEVNDQNIGLVKTLNKGLQLCSGSYIARMDADDYSYKDRFEKQISFMIKHNLDIVGCSIVLRNGEVKNEQRAVIFPMILKKSVKYCSCLAHPTWLVKREVYDTLNPL